MCVHQGTGTRHYGLKLTKGKRDRSGEDCVASSLLIAALHRACRAGSHQQLRQDLLQLQPEEGREEEQLQVSFLHACLSTISGLATEAAYPDGKILSCWCLRRSTGPVGLAVISSCSGFCCSCIVRRGGKRSSYRQASCTLANAHSANLQPGHRCWHVLHLPSQHRYRLSAGSTMMLSSC